MGKRLRKNPSRRIPNLRWAKVGSSVSINETDCHADLLRQRVKPPAGKSLLKQTFTAGGGTGAKKKRKKRRAIVALRQVYFVIVC